MLNNEHTYKETGINRHSPLLYLPSQSVQYPRSIPYGTMHLVVLNVVKQLFRLWRGKADCDQNPNAKKKDPRKKRREEAEDDELEQVFGDVGGGILDQETVDPEEWEAPPYVLSAAVWRQIGDELRSSGKLIPLCLGRAPQDPTRQKLRVST